MHMAFLHSSQLKLNDCGLLLKSVEPPKARVDDGQACFRSKQRLTPTRIKPNSRILLPMVMAVCGREDGLTIKFHGDLWNNDLLQSLQNPYGNSSYQERADRLVLEMKDLFKELGDGEISPSAYDTAWVARVPARHPDGSQTPQFPKAIKWLLNNQLQDGSWGFSSQFSLCDRLLSTLNSVIALLVWNTGNSQIKQGVDFIRENLKLLKKAQPDHFTPDFEIIFPPLLQKAKSLGLDLPYDDPYLELMAEKRKARLADISETDTSIHSIPRRMLNALEGLEDIIDWKKIMNFQSKDGSFLSSPASTACVLSQTGDERCSNFLNNLIDKFGGCVPCMYPIDILERLWLVDNIERLGLARHFTEEIKKALDYVYRHWSEKGIGCGRDNLFPDLNTTALGFRALRLHGYNVSSDVLKNFKDENQGFFSCAGQTHTELRSILNLFRATDLAFPGEEIMDEVRTFAFKYLEEALLATNNTSISESLREEIEYSLEYSWYECIPRLEARICIEADDDNCGLLRKTLYRMPYTSRSVCLELAKLDFNILQSMHQTELKFISKWWKESGMAGLKFFRQRLLESYLSSAFFEPEYSTLRIAFTKIANLEFVFDDLYDNYGTDEELKLFTEAIKRWDTSLMDQFPESMKLCFKVWFETMNEINAQVLKLQGRDMLNIIRKTWEMYAGAYLQEREWIADGYIPTLEEYLEPFCITIGVANVTFQPMLVKGDPLTDNALHQVHYPSKLLHLVSLCTRLTNDIKTFQAEKARGELFSSIECYMKDNPGCTEEDALKYLSAMRYEAFKEINLEYFKADQVPIWCKKFLTNVGSVGQAVYKYTDGYTNSKGKVEYYVKKMFIEPVPMN